MFLAIEAFIFSLSSLVIFIITYYLFSTWNRTIAAVEQGIRVIKIIDALMKILPFDPANKWLLLSTLSGPRCWKRPVPLQFWNNIPYIYGSSTMLETSPFAVMRMIWKTEDWGKWNPDADRMQYSLQQMEDSEMRNDNYMKCSKIVSVHGLQYYRFSHISANDLGWVFLWHVKKIDWWFFHVQPMTDYSHCLLSCMRGTASVMDVAKELSFTTNAIKDAVEIDTNLNVPINERISKTDYRLYKVTDVRSSHSSSDEGTKSSSVRVFKLIPHLHCMKKNKVCGFSLIVEKARKSRELKKDPTPSQIALGPKSSRRSGFASSVSIQCHRKVRGTSSVDATLSTSYPSSIKNPRRRSIKGDSKSGDPYCVRRTKTVSLVTDKDASTPLRQRWFSEASLSTKHANIVKSLSNVKSLAELSEKDEEETVETRPNEIAQTKSSCDTYVHKGMSNNNASHSDNDDHSKENGKLDEEYEILLPKIELSDHRLADLSTKGNHCAAQLQFEVIEASNATLDLNNSSDQSGNSRRWSFHSSYKGAILLSKMSQCGSLKIISYLCEIIIPLHPDQIWPTIRNPYLRFVYDETAKKVRILERIPNDQKIIHTYHESNNLLKREPIDFCLLHTERQEQSKYYVAFSSFEYENCPLMSNAVRGTLMPSGWAIELRKTNESKVSYLYQIIANKPNSSYIQDLSSMLPVAVCNLRTYVMMRPSCSQ